VDWGVFPCFFSYDVIFCLWTVLLWVGFRLVFYVDFFFLIGWLVLWLFGCGVCWVFFFSLFVDFCPLVLFGPWIF